MPSKKFKWGILGSGRIAHNFAGGLKVIDDASLFCGACPADITTPISTGR